MIYTGYCHSYWQNMQPIKSVLPFCSALPIQYTPLSLADITVLNYTVVVASRISYIFGCNSLAAEPIGSGGPRPAHFFGH